MTDNEQTAIGWDEIVQHSVYPYGAPSRVACHERAEYSAAVADPNALMMVLAARIATRAGYADADGECISVARKMMKEIAADVALTAYDMLERSPSGDKTFFVRIAASNPPGWQIRQVVAQAKRDAAKRNAPSESLLERCNREQAERIAAQPRRGTVGAALAQMREQGLIE